MKVTVESTSTIVTVDGVTGRIWKGTTERGVPVEAFIPRLALDQEYDATELESELMAVTAASAIETEPVDDATRDRYMAFADRFGRQAIPVEAEGIAWMSIIGALQLALRHPGFRGPSSKIVREFVRQMVARFVDEGAPPEAFEDRHP
jgi:hypothetical protein